MFLGTSYRILPSATARGATDGWTDRVFAAVAVFCCCSPHSFAVNTLLAVAIGIRDFASFFFFFSLRLHPSFSLLSPLSCPLSTPMLSLCVPRLQMPTTPPTTKSLVWSFFALYDSPAVFLPLALGFSANRLALSLEKNSTDRWGVRFLTKNTT